MMKKIAFLVLLLAASRPARAEQFKFSISTAFSTSTFYSTLRAGTTSINLEANGSPTAPDTTNGYVDIVASSSTIKMTVTLYKQAISAAYTAATLMKPAVAVVGNAVLPGSLTAYQATILAACQAADVGCTGL